MICECPSLCLYICILTKFATCVLCALTYVYPEESMGACDPLLFLLNLQLQSSFSYLVSNSSYASSYLYDNVNHTSW